MVGIPVTVVAVAAVLLLFAGVGLAVGRDRDLEEFAVARGTQGASALGLSFFASGVGAWVLFAPPEVGASVGLAGVVGYAVAITLPLLALVVLGRRLRALVPRGHNLVEFVRLRFGRGMHAYVLGISLVYMLVALAAELTATGAVLGRLSGLDPRAGVVAVAAVTTLYTAHGGLRASIRTDVWQGWLLLLLLGVVGLVAVRALPGSEPQGAGRLLDVDGAGLEGAATLVVAVLATSLFHNGYWQRVWSARDERALTRGALLGAAARVLVVLPAGLVGLLAAASAVDLGSPPVPFFALLAGAEQWVLLIVLVFTVALVTSTVDTLQGGLAAAVVTEAPRLGLRGARVLVVLLTVVPAVVAFQGLSVLRLFLVADLLCAATIAPAFLGLWRRATPAAAVAGAVAGLVGALVHGLVAGGSLAAAVDIATFAGGLSLPPFAAALTASTAVTVLVSLLGRRSTDLQELSRRVRPLDRPVDEQVAR
ncbi:sodium:solute symporter family transporter [Geodermatophilus chilensis]|uniref:sodium:solute symporter family transporter n=1 Tax=Geodermatophilus chilensis TaxID=2035835 RepID=UPI0018E3FC09|nr:hypothetical protein [Geodermatophilus chilensis]